MKSNKINITFALPNLLPGGAERVISFIADNLDREKFNCTLLIIGYSKDASYDIKNIDVVFFEKPRVLSGVYNLFKYIKTKKPDILVSAIGHLNSITACMSLLFPKTIFIAREVNVLSVLSEYEQNRKSTPFSFIFSKRFNFFEKVICQSQDMLDDFNRNFSVKDEKLIVINNPITDDFKIKEHHSPHKPLRFITVARFDLEKGHPRILEALSKLSFPFHYTLIGSGIQQESIFQLIEKYNIKDKITHISFTKEVAKHLSMTDVYLQGSYVEGFPNAIIESCMVGTPVIAFNAPGGINEIIIENTNGKIVENIDQFIDALEVLNNNYQFNSIAVSDSVNKRYSSKTILKEYESLFIQVYEKRKKNYPSQQFL